MVVHISLFLPKGKNVIPVPFSPFSICFHMTSFILLQHRLRCDTLEHIWLPELYNTRVDEFEPSLWSDVCIWTTMFKWLNWYFLVDDEVIELLIAELFLIIFLVFIHTSACFFHLIDNFMEFKSCDASKRVTSSNEILFLKAELVSALSC